METRNKISLAGEYFNKAYDLHLKGKIDGAINNYKLSIELYPMAKAHTYLGWAYSLRGNFEEAIEECRVAIEIDPDYGNPYNDIGFYLINLKRYDEAITWLEKALEVPDYQSKHYPYNNLGRIYESKGEWGTAMKYYAEAIRVNPDYEIARNSLIRLTAMMN